jgi:hypothetical protein
MADKRIDPKQPEKATPAAGARDASEAERTSLRKTGRSGMKKTGRQGLKKTGRSGLKKAGRSGMKKTRQI